MFSYNQCYYEYFQYVTLCVCNKSVSRLYAQGGLLWDLNSCDVVKLNQFTLTLAVDKSFCCSISLTPLYIIGLIKFSNQINVKQCLLVVLICISLITRKVEYLLTISEFSSPLLIIAKSYLCSLLYLYCYIV